MSSSHQTETATSNSHEDHKPHAPTEFVTDEPAVHRAAVKPRAVNRSNMDTLITVQPLKKSEMQPSYAQEMPLSANAQTGYASMINGLGSCAGTLGAIPCCFCCPNPYKSIPQGQVGLITRFGEFQRSCDPGLQKVNPFSEKLRLVDIKIQIQGIPTQNLMTRDNVSVAIDSVLYYHIINPFKAAFGISSVSTALTERAMTTLRSVIGTRTLQNLLTERETIAAEIEEILESVSEAWGVKIEAILIKDIVFSRELQESLSSAAQQKRIGESKVIAARAEVDAARLMRESADILNSPAALQIRQLESLQAMARSANSKVIFVPMNLFSSEGSGSSSAAKSNSGMSAGMLEAMANEK